MSYKLSWKPKFTQQSHDIIRSEDLGDKVDPEHFHQDQFSEITGVRDLLSAIGRPYLATIGRILATSLMIQLISVGSVLLAANTLKENLWFALPVTAGIYVLLRVLLTLLTNWTILRGNRMAAEMTGILTMRLGHHIALLSPHSQKAFSSGNLKTMAITDAQTVGDLIHSTASRGVGFMIAPLIAPFILFYLIGWPGIWAFASMLLMIPFSVYTSRKMMKYFQAELKYEDDCTTITGEWLKHQKTVRMMLANDFFEKKICGLKQRSFHKAKRGMYWAAFIFGFATRWWVVPPIAMILGAQYLGTALAMENIIGSIWYISILTGQLMGIPDLIVRGGKALAAFKRLVDLLAEPRLDASLVDGSSCTETTVFKGLALKDVSLAIDGKKILDQINIRIDLNKKTAIIGQLGSGKSTLLALMSGNLFPSEGKIHLEGSKNLYEIRERETYKLWRQRQVLVNQEAFIETSDIKSNVRLQHVSDDLNEESQLLQSLYDAAMGEDIASFRHGIHESLGETGINLSGGQKQRLSLARALYSSRSFLFLDDPLSAVDEAVADHLWERLVARCQGFVIATHRLKYVKSCDQVIVMDNGRITAVLHPKELIRRQIPEFTRQKESIVLGGLQ
ncbi:MAG: ATP-binding cassette domain-containing protein [Oligoflexus sp.]